MGIKGLLPVLKPICEQKHVKDFARTRVGVDAYGWLHRGVFGCASKICRGIDTNVYVDYCMYRVRMLIHFGATPVLVFDGAALPMKANTHAERQALRNEALRKAEEASAAGNARLAEEWYQRACPVTPEMARQVIRQCRKINVEYIVAPYEADAQLAWMMQTGYVDTVITEDSDLLVYGASKVMYKMTKSGDGDLYEKKNLPSLDTISMLNFTEDMFVYMCVCTGCDFFEGVQGLGIRKSHTLVRKYRTMSRLVQAIRHDRRYAVTKSFTADFARAFLVFRHQTVYDVVTSETVHLRVLDEVAKARIPHGVLVEDENGYLDLSFLGAHRDAMTAKRIAQGYLHPSSLREYEEPLDVIERPVTKKKRPISFPEPPKRLRDTTSKREALDIRGFQVQPATSASRSSFPTTANLRQRLSGGPRTFNPRRVAARFKSQNMTANTPNPTFSLTSNIWDKFRKKETAEESNNHTSKNGLVGLEQAVSSSVLDGNFASQDPDSCSEGEGPSPNQLDKRPRSSDVDCSGAKRMKLCSPGSHRVDAVNRAVARFASQPSEDKKFKFKPHANPPEPPSPDREAYELFQQIDADLSREAEETRDPNPSKSSGEVLHSKAKAEGHKQIRLSRFFSNKSTNAPDVQISRTDQLIKRKFEASARQNLLSFKRSLPKSNSLKSIDRFRRGATGKKVGVRGCNR